MATEADETVEVLREIRDELQGVRTVLVEQLRSARAGVRTEVVDRAGRWRMAAMASTGAVAFLSLVLALRAGRQPTTVVMSAPAPMMAAAAASPAPSPVATAAPVSARAKPAVSPAAKPTPKVVAVLPAATPATAPKRRAKPVAAKPALETAVGGDDDETMAFSPAPRRVHVHKMSYGPVESEPAKL